VSYAAIRKLLEVQLNTVGGVFPTAFENVPFKPDVAPWQRVNLLPAKTLNPTFGSAHKRETGVLQVTLYYPQNVGAASALARAETLRAGFPRGLSLVQGNVSVLIDEAPYIGPAANDGVWYQVPVSFPYIAEVF
jgi:hypothetical protein